MPSLLTKEKFIEKSIAIHGKGLFNYDKVIYKGARKYVTIGCLKCKQDFEQTPEIHNCKKRPGKCNKCPKENTVNEDIKLEVRKNLTRELFIIDAKLVHGDKYDYSSVIIDKNCCYQDIIKIICKKDNYEFNQRIYSHLIQKQGCIKCSNSYKLTTEEFIKRSKLIHGDNYDYSKSVYTGCDNPVIIICNTCKNENNQRPRDHYNQEKGCKFCSGNIKMTKDEFIKKAKLIHGDKYDYKDVIYDGNKKDVTLWCNNCNNNFTVRPNNHLACMSGCIYCINKSEAVCRNIFEELYNGYEFHKIKPTFLYREVTKYCLELDGYNKDLNIAFEYQGKQHYEKIYFQDDKQFKDLLERDLFKRNKCKEIGLLLIEIPYKYNFKNPVEMKEYIIGELKKNGKL